MNIEALYSLYLRHRSVSTDTRKIKENDIFFALKGPNFNANAFATQALEAGAAYAVIDDANYKTDDRCIVVGDVLQTLQALARHHRRHHDIPVIGITGSNGKTTTKELLWQVLDTTYRTHATQGNLNNHIGVPLTILSWPDDIEVAIVEMGANKIGDIQELVEIAEPTHGLITNIGMAHTQGFGSLEGVIRGKSELYLHLIKHRGEVFINSQNEILRNMGKRFPNPHYYPGEDDYYHCRFLEASPYVVLEAEDGTMINTHLIGAYNFENIAAALCVAKYLQVPSQAANKAIAAYVPSNNRSQIIQKGSNTIILDAYNANPNSMEAALKNLISINAAHKAVILGDMNELGEYSEDAHIKIGQTVSAAKFDKAIFCGKHIKSALQSCPDAHYFGSKEDLLQYLKENPFRDTTLLIKASRGIGLETIADHIS